MFYSQCEIKRKLFLNLMISFYLVLIPYIFLYLVSESIHKKSPNTILIIL